MLLKKGKKSTKKSKKRKIYCWVKIGVQSTSSIVHIFGFVDQKCYYSEDAATFMSLLMMTLRAWKIELGSL